MQQNKSLMGELTARQRRTLALVSALVVAVAFQGMTIARNNYSLWRPEFTAIELAVALVASFVAGLVVGRFEQEGPAWAARYVDEDAGWPYLVLGLLPAASVRAAVMTALLTPVNAVAVPVLIYRETVAAPLLAIPVRFLADIPQAILLCLAVMLVLRHRWQRA